MKRDFTSPEYQKQGGFTLMESMGSLLFYLIMISAAGVVIVSLFSGSKLSQAEQAISSLRLQVKQLYTSSSDYSGLDTDLAVKAGVVPEKMNKSNGVRNDWNGLVTVATGSDPNTFVITMNDIPQDAATKLAMYQAGSWVSVQVNGVDIDQTGDMVGQIAAAVADVTNTITFTSN
jgi:type II secretory pathway pseudopilin PulG